MTTVTPGKVAKRARSVRHLEVSQRSHRRDSRHEEAICRVIALLPVAIPDLIKVSLDMAVIAIGHLHAHQHAPIGGTVIAVMEQ